MDTNLRRLSVGYTPIGTPQQQGTRREKLMGDEMVAVCTLLPGRGRKKKRFEACDSILFSVSVSGVSGWCLTDELEGNVGIWTMCGFARVMVTMMMDDTSASERRVELCCELCTLTTYFSPKCTFSNSTALLYHVRITEYRHCAIWYLQSLTANSL